MIIYLSICREVSNIDDSQIDFLKIDFDSVQPSSFHLKKRQNESPVSIKKFRLPIILYDSLCLMN